MIAEPVDDAGRPDTDAVGVLARVAARSHSQAADENFPVALRLLPSAPRAHLLRVYGFARFVDDVGDDAPGDRRALLDAVAADLAALGADPASRPVLAPVADLAPLLADTTASVADFMDLVEANRLDQVRSRYETFDDLLGYCELSAAPIGRLVLHVAGAATPQNLADSDAVCAALQVFEHCQDVAEDALRGRVYLPAADVRAAGVSDADLVAGAATPALRAVVEQQVRRSLELLDAGRPLVRRLHGWARVAVAGYVAGGMATADALRAAGFDSLRAPVRPSRARTAVHAVRLWAGR
jgi:squalene synthase HpnC